MSKVTVAGDSIAYHTEEQVEQYGIGIVPINFYSDGRVYKDWADINPSQACQLFFDAPQSFRTSAASPADCLEIYRQASQRAKDILCVTVSSKLSTVYNVVLGAKEQAKVEFPDVAVEVLDSNGAGALGLAFYPES